jgi:hypothetical protein
MTCRVESAEIQMPPLPLLDLVEKFEEICKSDNDHSQDFEIMGWTAEALNLIEDACR